VKNSLTQARLYGIVDLGYVTPASAAEATTALLAGGVDILQLRAKNQPESLIESLGRDLLPLARQAGVPFIINDYPHLAARLGADGVHIGQDDGTLAEVKKIVGPDLIIGRSTHSLEQAQRAAEEGADYLGFGPLFPTGTKPGRPAIGLDDIAQVYKNVPVPVFCIGGINDRTLPAVLAAGAQRLVVVSALLQADDIKAATQSVKQLLR
jgi:thiamine-phosphate pyrophosphorylase